ncbi:MAG: TraX family protein [Thainema sp.]
MSLNNYEIKLLAAITMLIDHIGAVFFPGIAILRIIGRISFPLFVVLLVDGEKHTHNAKHYGLRLLLLGLVSQPIYQLLFESTQRNILFLLLLGLLCLRLVRLLPKWQLVIWMAGAAISQFLDLEYGAYGIGLIALIRYFQPRSIWWAGWIGLHLGYLLIAPGLAAFQFPAIFAPLLLYAANHQRGPKARWFYLFYPLHLLLLWLLYRWITNL